MTRCWRSQSAAVVSTSGLRDRQPRVVHHQVDAAVGGRRLPDGPGDRVLVADVDLDRRRHVRAAEAGGDGLGPGQVAVGEHDRRAFGPETGGDGPADAGRRPGHQGDPSGEGARGGSRRSFASSSSQYSMRNFSASSMGA